MLKAVMNAFQFVTIRYKVNVSTMIVVDLLLLLTGWQGCSGTMINVSMLFVVDSLSVLADLRDLKGLGINDSTMIVVGFAILGVFR